MTFRHDINALRALAVIIVVLFHFNEQILPGGFIGVDIFFVLSGYLMTNIIFTALDSKFSVLQFLKSRAKRILPPLMVLCACLLTLGWFFLPPTTYMILGKHVLSSLSFLSNLIYWAESGYFDSDSQGKFLLHTWSLSVEWQFYIAYPIALKLLSKLFNKQQLKMTVTLAFLAALIFSGFESYNDPAKAFFLLGPRVWELLFGGLLFLYPTQLSKPTAIAAESSGLIIILLSSIFINNTLSWPFPWALSAIIGTGLVITANRQQSLFSQNAFMQMIGKQSYSIYLWHWPVVVSLYYLDLLTQPVFIAIGILLSLLLGAMSYEFVEKHSTLTYKTFAAFTLLMLAAFFVLMGHSYPERLGANELATIKDIRPSAYRQRCHSKAWNRKTPPSACIYPKGEEKWAVLGDSHGVEFAAALASLLPANTGLKHLTHSNCAPSYLNINDSSCTIWTKSAVSYLLNTNSIDSVLITYRYSLYLVGKLELSNNNSPDTDKILTSLQAMVLQLAAAKKHVFIVLPVPEMQTSIHKQITTQYLYQDTIPNNLYSMTKNSYLSRNQIILNWFNHAPLPSNVHLINPKQYICDELNCFTIKNGYALYFDNNHLSVEGASQVLRSDPFLMKTIEVVE